MMHNLVMTSESLQQIDMPCSFHHWWFDPSDGQLRSSEKQVRLQPRIAKLLAIFLANPEQVIPREQLIEFLWQDKAVNEDALSRCIAELRSSLDDSSTSPIYIETVPKVGYRFLQPIKENSHKRLVGYLAALIIVIATAVMFLSQQDDNEIVPELRNMIISAERVTADPAMEYLPTLSPSGELIAYSIRDENRLAIRIIDRQSELIHTIKEDEFNLSSPAFPPDEASIFVVGVDQANCHIFQYQLPALNRVALRPCHQTSYSPQIDISPDGKYLAYIAKTEETNPGIWLYNLSKRSYSSLTIPTGKDSYDSSPRFSPDSNSIAFTRGNNSTREIYRVTADKPDEVQQITDGNQFITGLDWLNDNRHIVFDSTETGDRNLWLVNVNSQSSYLLGARNAQLPTVNSDNDSISFVDTRYNANIWRVSLEEDDSAPEALIESIKYNNFPAYSPDDKTIAFSTNRKGKSTIWLFDLETRTQKILLEIAGLNLFSPSWSPDGKRLIVSSRGKDGYKCFSVQVDSGIYHPSSQSEIPMYSCHQATDGSIYAVTRVPEQPATIIRVTPNSEETILLASDTSRIELSSTGQVLFTYRNQKGIYTLTGDSNEPTLVIDKFDTRLDDHWTVQGEYVYYPANYEKSGIWRHHLSSNTREFVTTQLPSAIGLTIAVNNKHTEFLFTRTVSRLSDIYVGQYVDESESSN